MKLITGLVLSLGFAISLPSFGLEGKIYTINDRLKSSQILEILPVIFSTPHPLRLKMRRMFEALDGKKTSGRAFNPAIVAHNDGYILSVRVAFLEDGGHEFFAPPKIFPGNRENSKFEKGKNFWWTDFASEKFAGGTLYFQADKSLENFIPLLSSNYAAFENGINGADIRLVKKDDQVAIFNSKISPIAVTMKLGEKSEDPVQFFRWDDSLRSVETGVNFSPLDVDANNKGYSYIDWFYPQGVLFVNVKNDQRTDTYLPYSNPEFPILGGGSTLEAPNDAKQNSGIMPLFSLGSSHINVGPNTYLGVGHIKIHVDEDLHKYIADSNIDQFRKRLVVTLKDKYGERYIRHDAFNSKLDRNQGFHYLMYFYIATLDDRGQPIAMKISDSFLPIDIKAASDKDNYVFSLVFPTGVTNKVDDQEKMLISAGIGDYYATLIEVPKQWAIDQCKHDVTNLNLKNYNYKIMRFDGEGSFTLVDQLE